MKVAIITDLDSSFYLMVRGTQTKADKFWANNETDEKVKKHYKLIFKALISVTFMIYSRSVIGEMPS